ncbi:MAG: endonuclease III domain-containing protein [Bacillota bacterium]
MTQDKIKTALHRLVDHYGHQDWWESDHYLADVVSMILIQQTTQHNMEKALENLKPHLSLDTLLAMEQSELETLIRPAGFYKQKSKYIKAITHWFHQHHLTLDRFDRYPTPALRQELLTIQGVGEETADVLLLYIFNRRVFVSDQYARRLFSRLGFGDFKTYRDMRQYCEPLVENISLKQCKEWHAAIDVHGKVFRQNPTMDESWLLD